MEKIYHPVSGEPVFMVSLKEKELIDVALDFMTSHCSRSESGANE